MERSEFLILLDRSYKKLLEALKVPVSQPLAIEGTIRRFELTYKIAIETIHAFFGSEHVFRNSANSCLRGAVKRGWIDDEKAWKTLIMSINHASYAYSENLAKDIYEDVKKNHHVFNSLINILSSMCQEEHNEMTL